MLALFLVETTKENGSDWMYIKKYLDTHCVLSPNHVVRPIYMCGKGEYDSNKVLRDIKKQSDNYLSQRGKDSDIIVFLCVDTDDLAGGDNAQTNQKKMRQIKKYCEKQVVSLVWFCRDIEEVFLGHSVLKKQKRDLAVRFMRDYVKMPDLAKLTKKDFSGCIKGTSNLHAELVKYFDLI